MACVPEEKWLAGLTEKEKKKISEKVAEDRCLTK